MKVPFEQHTWGEIEIFSRELSKTSEIKIETAFATMFIEVTPTKITHVKTVYGTREEE